ncbi:MAG: SagB/ThcOx family dehydrogenase [Prevotellaceae bacterium]|jgi:nitroreductase|nr:SagB/ThcOx family dehydrogenase [Prevotellaceae bacterium]
MKKYLFLAVALLGLSASAQDISLPQPVKKGGMPLMEALNNRASAREFSSEALDHQTLSNLLWAAWGYNRADKRTAPSANNKQELSLYVVLAGGAYLYDARSNKLLLVNAGDHRASTGKQPFVAGAPLNLVFVEDVNKKGWGKTDAGFISQNVYLYCASAGLATVVRGMFDAAALKVSLKLADHQQPVLTQTVGKKK